MSAHRDLTLGDGWLRVSGWRGEATTAYLLPTRGCPSAASVERSVRALVGGGYRAAVTSALGPAEQQPFLAAGFTLHERLHLLTRSVDDIPASRATTATLRRGRRADRAALLAVDGDAFTPFWQLDDDGLVDALSATPSARLRVAVHPASRHEVAAYAITGRAGTRGYLQRLAVDPALKRQGVGSALVLDGLRWLRRWGSREVLVNTQVGNDAAVALYEALGFCIQPEGLAVLRRDLDLAAP